jgi:hypothetical protein
MRPPLCYSPMHIRHLISEQGTRVTVTVAGEFSLLVPTQLRYECVAAIVRGHPLNAIRQMRGPPVFAEDKMRPLAPVECKRASIRERDAAVGACVHSRHAIIERESMSAERRAAERSLFVVHDHVDRAVCLASHERILRAVRKEALGQPRGIGHVYLAVPPVARPQCEWGRAALADACCAERVRGLAPAIQHTTTTLTQVRLDSSVCSHLRQLPWRCRRAGSSWQVRVDQRRQAAPAAHVWLQHQHGRAPRAPRAREEKIMSVLRVLGTYEERSQSNGGCAELFK